MKTEQYNYKLPDERIAKYPPKERGKTNLLVLNRTTSELSSRKYFEIPEYVEKGDLIVLNNTKVEKARLFPTVARSGKAVELLFLHKISSSGDIWYALIGRAKNVRRGDKLLLDGVEQLEILDRKAGEAGFEVKLVDIEIDQLFAKYGHIPLPPYMKRADTAEDQLRYNTVFASAPGSVAAPTASLNLTDQLIAQFREKGAEIAYVDLQVSWGTFAPVRTEQIEDFKIHSEFYTIPEVSTAAIQSALDQGRKIWAFGTTVCRVLESNITINPDGTKQVHAGTFDTQLYIYPGYQWKAVNRLVTNFHAPHSSLIILVAAFAGYELTMKAYQTAIDNKYNFLSYGDSMLIL